MRPDCVLELQKALDPEAENSRLALVESIKLAKRAEEFCQTQARKCTVEHASLLFSDPAVFCFSSSILRVILTGATDTNYDAQEHFSLKLKISECSGGT